MLGESAASGRLSRGGALLFLSVPPRGHPRDWEHLTPSFGMTPRAEWTKRGMSGWRARVRTKARRVELATGRDPARLLSPTLDDLRDVAAAHSPRAARLLPRPLA